MFILRSLCWIKIIPISSTIFFQNIRPKIISPRSDIMRQMFDYILILWLTLYEKNFSCNKLQYQFYGQTKAIKMCNKWIQYNIYACVCERWTFKIFIRRFFVVYSLWLRKKWDSFSLYKKGDSKSDQQQ